MGKDRILFVDDDQDILDLLKYNLEREGFKVRTVSNSLDAVSECEDFHPDLIILDIMMPGINGIEACKKIRAVREFKETFIFFLSAKSERYYREAALDIGGDDFIEKIVGIRALTNKIKTVLKRKLVIRNGVPEIHLGDLYINRRSGTARLGHRAIHLSQPELDMLFFFAQNPRRVISTDSLQTNLWGSNGFSVSTSVEGYVNLLIQKLGGGWITKVSEGKYRLLP